MPNNNKNNNTLTLGETQKPSLALHIWTDDGMVDICYDAADGDDAAGADDGDDGDDDDDGGGGDDAHCTYGQRFVLFGIGLHSSDYFATPDSLPLEHKYTNTPIHFYNQISIN